MKLQRILAKDSRSANEQAIAKYGRDVLIVSNSRVNGMTELIVAVDVEPEKMPPPQMPRGAAEQFEAALRQQRDRRPEPEDTIEVQARAIGSDRSAAAAGHAPNNAVDAEAFVPAHMALMQAAQRAAAHSLGQTEPLRAPEPSGSAPWVSHEAGHATGQSPASHSARPSKPASTPARPAAPRLHYGQQFSLNQVPLTTLPLSGLSVGPSRAASLEAPSSVSRRNPEAVASPGSDFHDVEVEPTPTTHAVSSDKAHALTELIRAEIAQLRKEMRMGQQLQAWAAQGRSHRWNEALSEVGVPTALRALLMSGLSNDYDDEQALAAIESQMEENLPRPTVRGNGRSRRPVGEPWSNGVHLLSGPSGSGKTSMAARLAHEAAQRLGVERVVLVSWNDNRPGAWGQLQLWASRIGVAAFRAADSGTLDLLLQEHRGSLVIVDSGLSQPDILNASVQGLNAQLHLVVSADANAATLRRWIGPQAPAWADMIVTRLDESAQPWPLLQACCEHQLLPTIASDGGGLTHLRQPYGAQALLQHGMGVLATALGAPAGELSAGAGSVGGIGLDIPTIDRITTTVPPRQAGRSGRSMAGKTTVTEAAADDPMAAPATRSNAKAAGTASARTRHGAPHA